MRKKITLWKCSVACFVLTFLYGLWFVNKKTIPSLILLLILITGASIFYVLCSRRITLPGGYTAIQAQRFYRSCIDAGLDSRRKLTENEALLQSVLQKYDFAQKMDSNAVWELFCNGRSIDDATRKS